MKSKFASLDVCAVVHDLKRLIGMRVVNVYDIDSKTYLVKLHKPTDKAFILFESGVRIHITNHDWSKSQVPSGFSMKFRKHIRQRRLTSVSQIGVDRIVDMTFGDEEYACHVIVELYDRGNIVLTDSDYKILNVLRPRTDHDHDVRFSVRQTYPVDLAKKETFMPSIENIKLFLEASKPTDLLRKALVRHVPFSGQLLEHGFLKAGLPANVQVKDISTNEEGAELLNKAMKISDDILKELAEQPSKGYITFKKITNSDGNTSELYEEYNPISFAQFSLPDSPLSVKEFPTFSDAVDNFYSQLDSQKVQQRSVQMENEAVKKLENVKRDHDKRLKALDDVQVKQQKRAELIEMNRELVEQCLTVVRQALANKMTWDEIQKWVNSAATQGNPIAQKFVRLNFFDNSITLRLSDPYEHLNEDEVDEDQNDEDADNTQKNKKKAKKQQPRAKKKEMEVDLDLGLTADQNARQHFTERKAAAVKQQKTLQSSAVALKNAQKQAQNKVKQVRTNTTLARARKIMWFEKFYWCISSDGYLIIGGRDAQQNEMIVKRYLRPGDVYVHADLAGASSVVVRNKSKNAEIPPMTLNEAGSMAVCYSNAWDAKVVVSAWWVHHEQVSRTAPTGEYLTAGSFMIRGKKNFLPSVQLQLGFGLMFRVDEESTERRQAELKERMSTRANSISVDSIAEEQEQLMTEEPQNNDDEIAEEIELNKDGRHVEDEEEEMEDEQDEEFPDVKVDLESLNLNSTTGDESEELILASLVPDPRPDDSLLFITAVCGPYSTMHKFKYKVKITPGTGKRGRAVKTALALFQSDKTATVAERALVKLLASDPAIIQQLPSKVNVLAPQLMKVRK